MISYTGDESATTDSFEAMFRVNINNDKEFTEWLKIFQRKNNTQFNVINFAGGEGRYVDFKWYLKCIHCVKGGKIGTGKHTGCPARITATIRSIPKQVATANVDDMGGLNSLARCVVKLAWTHNHPLLAPDFLRRHNVPAEVDDKLLELLRRGHSIKSALKCMEMEIDESVEDDTDYSAGVDRKRRSVLPDYRHSYHVFRKRLKKEGHSGGIAPNNAVGLLKLVENINDVAGEVCAVHDEYEGSSLIGICTPFMKRVQRDVPEAGEVVYVESSGEMHKGKGGYHVLVMMTHSMAGGIAALTDYLVCKYIITTTTNVLRRESAIQKGSHPEGFATLRQCWSVFRCQTPSLISILSIILDQSKPFNID